MNYTQSDLDFRASYSNSKYYGSPESESFGLQLITVSSGLIMRLWIKASICSIIDRITDKILLELKRKCNRRYVNKAKVLTDAKAAQAIPNPGKWKGAFCDINKARRNTMLVRLSWLRSGKMIAENWQNKRGYVSLATC